MTVEHVPIERLKTAPWNPRTARDERFAQLCRSLEADPDFLEQRPILAQADGTVFAGNHRLLAAQHLGWATVPAIVADVPDQLAKQRAMIDNNNAADWLDDDLGALLTSLGDAGSDLSLLGFEAGELERLLDLSDGGDGDDDATYSRKIETPIYEPTGPKPSVGALFDDTKTQELIRGIEAAEGLTDDERDFLIIAAQRHTVLHFGNVAEYYAHADSGLQTLMEDSALVIIDFDRAIELGYVRVADRIAELYGVDYPDG